MVVERKRTPKTESLTIRLDPRTRFMLELISKLRGQTITTVVERAIHEAANSASFWSDAQRENVDWRNVWDVSDGVRALQMAAEPALFPVFEEEQRLAFAREHWPFFYTNSAKKVFRRPFIDILWPRIDEFVTMHVEGRAANYFAAGKAMQQALNDAGVLAPDWPQPTEGVHDIAADLDDEIPF